MSNNYFHRQESMEEQYLMIAPLLSSLTSSFRQRHLRNANLAVYSSGLISDPRLNLFNLAYRMPLSFPSINHPEFYKDSIFNFKHNVNYNLAT